MSEQTVVWKGQGLPRLGWVNVSVEDALLPDEETCDICGTFIRYIYTIKNDMFPDSLGVGRVCCGKLCTPADGIEHELRLRANRRKKWLDLKGWWVNDRGNHILRHRQLGLLTVFRRGDGWKYVANEQFSGKAYLTAKDAKMALFDDLFPAKLACPV